MKSVKLMFAIGLMSILVLNVAIAAEEKHPVGTVVFVLGDALARGIEGTGRKLTRKAPVYALDTIHTNQKSQVQIRFKDNAFISVRPNSSFTIDAYSFNDTEENKQHLNLVKGGFRAITGQIGKMNKQAFKLKTPVATLGIRGTDFTVMYCRSDCGEGERGDTSAQNGLYVGVISGGVTLQNELGNINIGANEYGFVNALGDLPKTLRQAPSFLMFDRTQRDVRKIQEPESRRTRENPPVGKEANEGKNESSTQTTTFSPEPSAVIESIAEDVRKQAALTSPSLGAADSSYALFGDMMESRFGSDGNVLLPSTENETVSSTAERETVGEGLLGMLEQAMSSDSANNLDDPLNTIPGVSTNQNQAFSMATGSVGGRIGRQVINHSEARVTGYRDNQVDGVLANTTNDAYLFTQTQYLFDGTQLDLGYDATTGLRWGRWASGTVTFEGETADPYYTRIKDQMHWVAGDENSMMRSLPISGTATYSLYGGTAPTDSAGNVGQLGSVTLTADFNAPAMVSNATVELTIDNQNWKGEASTMPIQADTATFSGLMQVNVTSDTSAGNPGLGHISGFFVGGDSSTVPSGAGISYEMTATSNGAANTVSGSAALRKDP
ncbi:MAG: FecR family protein [Gammaproteobacteria bacterium]|nr:FecR family protein [Gammaproteobacteria bacterium]